MNFVSTGVQRPAVLTLLPLSGLRESLERISLQVAEKEAQAKAGALDARRRGDDVTADAAPSLGTTIYDFSPSVNELIDELLPLTIKTALWQCVLDAVTSEHIARMVAMKSATDAADKLIKKLTMQYNRARQGQITTELAEIMGGVEAMKSAN
jgi:F-type H+-transporting ATPase subunit gamma